MTDTPIILPFGMNDLVEIAAMEKMLFDDPLDADRLMKKAARSTIVGWTVRVPCTSVIIGYLLCDVRYKSIRIVRIAVAPKFRRRGLGSILMRWLHGLVTMLWLYVDGFHVPVYAAVDPGRRIAQRFLKKHGFSRVRKMKNGKYLYRRIYEIASI